MVLGTLYLNTDIKTAKWSHISEDAKRLFKIALSASFKKRYVELQIQEIHSIFVKENEYNIIKFETLLLQMCSELEKATVQMIYGKIHIVDKATFDKEKIYITVSKEISPYYIVV